MAALATRLHRLPVQMRLSMALNHRLMHQRRQAARAAVVAQAAVVALVAVGALVAVAGRGGVAGAGRRWIEQEEQT